MRNECMCIAARGDKLCAMPLILLQTTSIGLRVATMKRVLENKICPTTAFGIAAVAVFFSRVSSSAKNFAVGASFPRWELNSPYYKILDWLWLGGISSELFLYDTLFYRGWSLRPRTTQSTHNDT